MLRDGQRLEGAVKEAAARGALALRDDKLAVVRPDPRHLVHEHEGALERVVHGLVARVVDAAATKLGGGGSGAGEVREMRVGCVWGGGGGVGDEGKYVGERWIH